MATDESYLREVPGRIDGNQGERPLPDTLPERKHCNTNDAFWAVRHHSKAETANCAFLPLSCRVGHSIDEKPVGLIFSFSPGASNLATIDYLSGDEDYLRCIQGELFRQSEPGVAEMRMQYGEAQSGVLEGLYNLDEMESARYLVFVLSTAGPSDLPPNAFVTVLSVITIIVEDDGQVTAGKCSGISSGNHFLCILVSPTGVHSANSISATIVGVIHRHSFVFSAVGSDRLFFLRRIRR
jgi:hypothetical protein